ncbi:7073_t:CDS:2, partial [Gigaspora margarita]
HVSSSTAAIGYRSFNDKVDCSELYEKVEYLEAYIGEVEYSRLEDEAMHSRLYGDENFKGTAEIKSDVCDSEVEYSRLEVKYSRERGCEENS